METIAETPHTHEREAGEAAAVVDAAVAADAAAAVEAAAAADGRTAAQLLHGLSAAEVLARRAAGQGNDVAIRSGRTYAQIVLQSVFNFINDVLFALGITLVALGRYSDALVSVGVVMANVVVSLVQEVRAKRTLDRIAILTRPKAAVVRDAVRQEVSPGEIVLGDTLVLESGDQVVVDGEAIGDSRMEVDESLLTGESDLVDKKAGDELFSGSFCVTGEGLYVARRVGLESLANKLTAGAQAARRVLTPLQRQVNIVVRALLALVILFEILVVIQAVVDKISFVESVRMSTVIVALVPNGLILAIAVAYALGGVRMAGKGALIQKSNAVESMSNVDVLCTDKTGTLTSGNVTVEGVKPYGIPEDELERLLGDYARSTTGSNRTGDALSAAFDGARQGVAHEILFSSARKWSALVFDDGARPGVYALGAPEMLVPYLVTGAEGQIGGQVTAWANAGLRVLLLAHHAAGQAPYDGAVGGPSLPRGMTPLGLVSLSDELRPKVRDTLAGFAQAGIKLKVISGDNPHTVAALAKQAGLGSDLPVVNGPDLAEMDDAQLAQAADEAIIFGRVTPHQKERLVRALRSQGHYVAMIGDGVNDVISLKGANVGIAMQSGSQAARGVADLVLLGDSFAALPWAFREGQRICAGMQDILNVFMVRLLSKALLIATVPLIAGFPFAPRQASLLSFFAAGVPAIALAAWAEPVPGAEREKTVFPRLARFAVPPGLLLALMGLGVYVGYLYTGEHTYLHAHLGVTHATAMAHSLTHAQTALTVFAVLCSLLLLPFTVPPTRFWTGGAQLRGDWRATLLAVGLAVVFAGVLAVPFGRHLFELSRLRIVDYALLVALTAVWGLLTRWLWRADLMARFLGVRSPEV